MVDVHGVVGGLVEAVEDADAAAGLGGGGEDREGEGLLVHHLRAAEGEHEAARGDLAIAAAFRRWYARRAFFSAPRCFANAGGSTIMRSYFPSGTSRRNSMASAQ